jgi:competence ComEA-like helix-hairpin-helix protein
MKAFSSVDFRRRVWLQRLCGLVLVMAINPGAGVAAAQEKAKKLPPPSRPFDINTATYDQFHSLPGVGPVTAQRILDFRKKSGPFQRVEDLLAVRGISAGRLEKIRPFVMVKPLADGAVSKPAAPAKTPVKAPTPVKKPPVVKDPGGEPELQNLMSSL